MMFAPLEGWRLVKVTERRTAVDYAHALKNLSKTICQPVVSNANTLHALARARNIGPG